MASAQTTSTLLLIRPARFGANPETAPTNAFQGAPAELTPDEIHAAALAEFDAFGETLAASGIRTLVYDDDPSTPTPDAVFPNNWITFHESGHVVLYPMLAPSRRREVRRDVIDRVRYDLGVAWPHLVDLTPLAERGEFLEGTGSLVLDRPNRTAYACLSPRTTRGALDAFAKALGYEVVTFHSADPRGHACYHTNVMMNVGHDFAIICLDSIPDGGERRRVRARLESSGRTIIPITTGQRDRFAGNALEVSNRSAEPCIILSRQALGSLDDRQRDELARHARIISSPLETIETHGGGSARCMLAEVFIPTA